MQKLPQADYRVDTGPLQIGNDWPGYFFRGDETFNIVTSLQYAAERLGSDSIAAMRLRDIAAEMEKCWIKNLNSLPATD